MVGYTMTYEMRAKRRNKAKIESDREESIRLLNEGYFVEEIAVELGITYTQVHRELKRYYPNSVYYEMLVASQKGKRRLTLDEIYRAEKLLKLLPLKTVAAILGISWHRLSKLGSKPQRIQNTRLLGQVSEWLLARYLRYKFPNTEWEVLTCLGNTSYAPDFHSENQWWDSKAYYSELNRFEDSYKRQYSKYLEIIPQGTVVYWFGCRDSILSNKHGLRILEGKDLLKALPSKLQTDINRFLNGDFIQLAKEWYGLY